MEVAGIGDKVRAVEVPLSDDMLMIGVLAIVKDPPVTMVLAAEALIFAIPDASPRFVGNSETVELSKLFSKSHSSSPA